MKFNNAIKLKATARAVQQLLNKFPDEMGTIAISHFKRSFPQQGFEDDSVKKWQERKLPKGRVARTRSSGRNVLIGLGTGAHLWNSLRKRRVGVFTIMITSSGRAEKYANVHNEGMRAGRGRGFKMPKRQFVGYSGKLNRKIISTFEKRMERILSQ